MGGYGSYFLLKTLFLMKCSCPFLFLFLTFSFFKLATDCQQQGEVWDMSVCVRERKLYGGRFGSGRKGVEFTEGVRVKATAKTNMQARDWSRENTHRERTGQRKIDWKIIEL